MLNKRILSERLSGMDPVYYYIFAAAAFVFLCAGFGSSGSYPFDHWLIFPCLLFFKEMISRPLTSGTKKALGLSLVMVGWFTFLQLKRMIEYFDVTPFAPFFCIYLFAFPLAFFMQDGEKKHCLKVFAFALSAASTCMSIASVFLMLDLLPAATKHHLYWYGARLYAFYHPNMAACLLMFGVAATLAFFHDATKLRTKFVLLAVIALQFVCIVLTNCRTVMFLVIGLCAGNVFFSVLKGWWKLLLPALIAVIVVFALLFINSNPLFRFHSDALINKYLTQEEQPQESDVPANDTPKIYVNKETGEVSLRAQSQHSLSQDLESFNSRTGIWKAAFFAISESRSIQLFGVGNIAQYLSYYFTDFNAGHAHNSWIQCMLGLGIPGFAIAMVFTLFSLWNCIVILLKHAQDGWKRITALLVLCLMAASFLEPYLFLTDEDYHIFNFVFFLFIGYLAHWQEEDNRKILHTIRKLLHI